jgi:hypothetical protein
MKWAKDFFNFYLEASFHVALAAYSLVWVTVIMLNIPADRHLCYALFFGTIACYNFIKYGVEAHKYILVSGRYVKLIQSISIAALFLAFYHFYFLPHTIWIAVGLLILFTALYTLPVLPGSKNFRSLGGFKIFIVAMVWALATVILPLFAAKKALFPNAGIELVQRFLLISVLMLPFEIRDLNVDPPQLHTIPQRLGIKKTKWMGVVMAGCFFLLSLAKHPLSGAEIGSKGVMCVLLLLMLWQTKEHQSKYFASFWVESVPLMWWGITLCMFYG